MAGMQLAQNRWRARCTPKACAADIADDATRMGMAPEEMQAVRWYYRSMIFEVVARIRDESVSAKVSVQQVVAATACVLWSAFTLPACGGYSMLVDIHAEVLVCAVVSIALKLHHHTLQLAHVVRLWKDVMLRRAVSDASHVVRHWEDIQQKRTVHDGPALPVHARGEEGSTEQRCRDYVERVRGYVARIGDARVVECCEYYIVGGLGEQMHVVHPFGAAEAVLRRWVRPDVCAGESIAGVGEGGSQLHGADRELCALVVRYTFEAHLTDVPLYTPPSVVALVAVQRAAAACGVPPPRVEDVVAPLDTDADIAAYRSAVASAHAELTAWYATVDAVRARGRLGALSALVRNTVDRAVPRPEGL